MTCGFAYRRTSISPGGAPLLTSRHSALRSVLRSPVVRDVAQTGFRIAPSGTTHHLAGRGRDGSSSSCRCRRGRPPDNDDAAWTDSVTRLHQASKAFGARWRGRPRRGQGGSPRACASEGGDILAGASVLVGSRCLHVRHRRRRLKTREGKWCLCPVRGGTSEKRTTRRRRQANSGSSKR